MKPVLQALVLAERIYEDRVSGKKIIAGTFNQLTRSSMLAQEVQLPDGSKKSVIPGGTDPGCPSAYISLTDVLDGTEINLQYVNTSKNEVLFQMGVMLSVQDRLATIEIVVPLPPMARLAPEAGDFSFDLICEGEIVGSHRLRVLDASPEGS